MLLDEVANYLVTQGVGVAGSTANWAVSKGFVPDSPDRLFSVIETGGLPNEGHSTGTVDRPTFQLRARGNAYNYSTARAKMESARASLETVMNLSIGATPWRYVHIKAMAPPLFIGQDERDRPTVVINFWAYRSRTS